MTAGPTFHWRSISRQGKGGRTLDEFVVLTDLAPTLLEAARLETPRQR